MTKVIRNGKVAVLYSPDFGAGWYTWNVQYPDMLFDPYIVELVENSKKFSNSVIEYCKGKYPNAYLGGVDTLRIAWLDEGTDFTIEEYDGSEWVNIKENVKWIKA